MSRSTKVPQEIIDVLEVAGEYELEQGTRHTKIKVAGRQVGILPHGQKRDGQGRGRNHKNLVCSIKRRIRELQELAVLPPTTINQN